MHTPSQWKTYLDTPHAANYFRWLYGAEADGQSERYAQLLDAFQHQFGNQPVFLFSAPGRTEIGGNHTDHQQGHVLAGAITRDMIAAVSPRDDGMIHFYSAGFCPDIIDTTDLSMVESEKNCSAALIRGICARFKQLGHAIGGFDCYQTSRVATGSGLSSSAAFEVLVGTILNGLYNAGRIPPPEIALIGQYAENVYFGKPSGLMDQMAASVGGVIFIDFAVREHPVIEKIPYAVGDYTLCIVNAGGSHADLTDEYAAIPAEMKQVAQALGSEVLSQVEERHFYEKIGQLRKCVSDRALLRAMHFFQDDRFVMLERQALRSGDVEAFCRLVTQSGRSSYQLLQNCFPARDPGERSVSLALALTERLLAESGAYRIHGGGFAGTIQAFVPTKKLADYIVRMELVFGSACCFPVSIRPVGGTSIPKDFMIYSQTT
jgi:galactokinase